MNTENVDASIRMAPSCIITIARFTKKIKEIGQVFQNVKRVKTQTRRMVLSQV
jgi:hypothetical protein